MVKYYIVQESRVIEDLHYTAYGIAASDGTYVSDISNKKEEVEEILKKINMANLSPLHLKDVIEDAIQQ